MVSLCECMVHSDHTLDFTLYSRNSETASGMKVEDVRSLRIVAFGLAVFIRHLQIEPATASDTITMLQPVHGKVHTTGIS